MGYNSTPGFSILHQLPELAQIYVYWVSDAIQPAHPLSASSPAFNLFRHQGLFQWVKSSHQVEFQLQHLSFQWVFRISFLYDGLIWSPCSAGTLKSLLQHHSSKASSLQHSAFFLVHLSHPKNKRVPENNLFLLCWLCQSLWLCEQKKKLWKILKEMGIPDHLTCLLRSLYSAQEARVRTRHVTKDWFQIGKGVRQGCNSVTLLI